MVLLESNLNISNPVIAIIANGEMPDENIVSKYLPDADMIIAVDGGANICQKLDITPQFIVGDFDSITTKTRRFFKGVSFVELRDQNFSDLHKAISFALEHKPQKLKLFSTAGKRSDHTFSNLIIFDALNTSVPIEVYDDAGVLSMLSAGKHKLDGKPGYPVSLFSIRPLKCLSLRGFKYEVQSQDFAPSFNGTSNSFISNECHVEFESGRLFVYLPFKE